MFTAESKLFIGLSPAHICQLINRLNSGVCVFKYADVYLFVSIQVSVADASSILISALTMCLYPRVMVFYLRSA